MLRGSGARNIVFLLNAHSDDGLAQISPKDGSRSSPFVGYLALHNET